MGWIIALAAIVVLVINAVICSKFSEIAEEKGHNGDAYFWACFFLGIIGYCMVAALPDRTLHAQLRSLAQRSNQSEDQPKSLFGSKQTSAPRQKSVIKTDGSWICGLCKAENGAAYDHCRKCGKSKS